MKEQQKALTAKLRGHSGYYGHPTNYQGIWRFYRMVRRNWKKWLDRRTRGKTLNWNAYALLLLRHPLLRPRITRSWTSEPSPV